jgi:hypothetical protein
LQNHAPVHKYSRNRRLTISRQADSTPRYRLTTTTRMGAPIHSIGV